MYKKILSLACITLLCISVLPGSAVADGGPEHQVEQPRPISLGTSGGNINDISKLYCCSGTLGALVENGEIQFILSNNHVLAKTNLGQIGDAIMEKKRRCPRSRGIIFSASALLRACVLLA